MICYFLYVFYHRQYVTFGLRSSVFLNKCYVVVCLCDTQQNLAAVLEKEDRTGLVNGKEAMVHVPVISSATSTTLKGLFMVLDFLYRDKCRSETKLKCQPEKKN